ncbi:MAG: cysteine desulfurase [Chloroflexi bacterium]|nr:cysteine desulfurase [Chloroflexota bacterium]
MTEPIYLDHAATTPIAPEVLDAMLPFLRDEFGNPSSIYELARGARRALDDARESVAEILGARPGEIVFTSGGTESINLALKGRCGAAGPKKPHIVTSSVEHLAVLNTCAYLERHGFWTTHAPVDRHGQIDPEAVLAAVAPETAVVSLQHANNEIGTIQPIERLARALRERGVPLHVDACQSAGTLPIDVERLGVDFLSLTAHKMYGPKGIGVLYTRRGVAYHPTAHGGSNERGRRAGTENVPGVVGLAAALRLASSGRDANNAYLGALASTLIDAILARVAGARLTGHPRDRLPNFASFVIEGIEGESMLLALDARRVYASSGAACTSGTLDPSHVLTAIGLPADLAHGSLRMTVGLTNTPEQIERAIEHLVAVVERLRALGHRR